MREIQFRTWDGKKIIYDIVPFQWDFVLDRGWWKCLGHWDDGLPQFRLTGYPFQVIMQYTGLKDKNGKEIYEGDIIERNGLIREVHWHEFTARWRMTGHTGVTKGDMALMCEVIGNIYENGELLQ